MAIFSLIIFVLREKKRKGGAYDLARENGILGHYLLLPAGNVETCEILIVGEMPGAPLIPAVLKNNVHLHAFVFEPVAPYLI